MQIYRFLTQVRPSAKARSSISCSQVTLQSVFPTNRQYRVLFSLFVLEKHIRDFYQLGVADSGFIQRSIRLLTAYLCDVSRPFQPHVLHELMKVLVSFLQGTAALHEVRVTVLTQTRADCSSRFRNLCRRRGPLRLTNDVALALRQEPHGRCRPRTSSPAATCRTG